MTKLYDDLTALDKQIKKEQFVGGDIENELREILNHSLVTKVEITETHLTINTKDLYLHTPDGAYRTKLGPFSIGFPLVRDYAFNFIPKIRNLSTVVNGPWGEAHTPHIMPVLYGGDYEACWAGYEEFFDRAIRGRMYLEALALAIKFIETWDPISHVYNQNAFKWFEEQEIEILTKHGYKACNRKEKREMLGVYFSPHGDYHKSNIIAAFGSRGVQSLDDPNRGY